MYAALHRNHHAAATLACKASICNLISALASPPWASGSDATAAEGTLRGLDACRQRRAAGVGGQRFMVCGEGSFIVCP